LELIGLFSITASVLLGVDPTLALARLVVGFGWGCRSA